MRPLWAFRVVRVFIVLFVLVALLPLIVSSENVQPQGEVELSNLRTINSKTYLVDDNEYRTDFIAGSIHYQEDPNTLSSPWLEIDPNITSSSRTSWDWEVTKGHYTLLINNDTSIALGIEGNWLGFRFDGFGYLDWSTKEYEILSTRQSVTPVVSANSIRWENICPNVNLEYVYSSDGFKENIEITQAARDWLVANPPSSYGLSNADSYLIGFSLADWSGSYSAETNTGSAIDWDVSNELTEGSIIFKHPVKDKILAALPVGEAFLADESYIETIPLRHRFIKVGSDYRLLYGAKVLELNTLSAGTIIIDPTTIFQPDGAASMDTWITSSSPTTNYGTGGYIRLFGHTSTLGHNLYTFNVSSLGDATVSSATLSLYDYDSDGTGYSVRLYRQTRYNWVETGATWNNYKSGSAWSSAGGDYVSPYTSSSTTGTNSWQSWSATVLVQDAIDDRDGIVNCFIRMASEPVALWKEWRYRSGEYATAANRPKLSITYVLIRTLPTVVTNVATSVEETTANLHGNITDRGGEDLSCRGFVWDIVSRGAPGNVSPSASSYANYWTECAGSYPEGTFAHSVTSLPEGDVIYYRATCNNSVGWSWGDEVNFLTKPDAPSGLIADNGWSSETIDLSWSKGDGALTTEIWGQLGSYPSARGVGTLTYNSTGTSYADTNPSDEETWYYRAWSFVSGSSQYSDSYSQASATCYEGFIYGDHANPVPCSTAQMYEFYQTGGANATAIYGDNWIAQTFTVGVNAHTVDRVRLKLYGVGTVGSVTVAIKDTTLAGHPDAIGDYLVYTVVDGDAISTYSGGTWTNFDFAYPLALEADTEYAIVVGAPYGIDTSNALYASYTISGTYGYGNYEYSANGGTTWYSETDDDFLFEVWGEESFDICNVQMYSDFRESGDWLLTACYQCAWAPFSPDTNPQTCFSAQFLIDGDIKASIGMPLWGKAPMGIYMSAEMVEQLEWGANNSVFRLIGTGACGGITEYTSEDVVWIGSNLNMLDDWVLRTAGEMEEYYSIAFTTLAGSEVVLNEYGGAIFDISIPYLCCVREHLYYMPCVCEPDNDFGGYYQGSLNWQSLLGPRLVAALNTTGAVVDISGKSIAQVGFLVLFAAIVVVTAVAVPEHKGFACVMLALPFAFVGFLIGVVPMAAIAGMASIAVIAMVWAIWLMRT